MTDNRINYGYTGKASPLKSDMVKEMLSRPSSGASFEAVLKEQLDKNSELQFSKHARERVDQRGINITNTLLDSLNEAVDKARAKGARDVVIIGPKEAFIVNVTNNVVVTTMSGNEMKDNIFTNIDSAIIL